MATKNLKVIKIGDGEFDLRPIDTKIANLETTVSGKTSVTVEDNLTSDSATSALSAKQGKALKTLVDGKTSVTVEDNLTSDSATTALSAKQGKALKTLVDGKTSVTVEDNLTSDSATSALSAKQGKALNSSIGSLNTLTSGMSSISISTIDNDNVTTNYVVLGKTVTTA